MEVKTRLVQLFEKERWDEAIAVLRDNSKLAYERCGEYFDEDMEKAKSLGTKGLLPLHAAFVVGKNDDDILPPFSLFKTLVDSNPDAVTDTDNVRGVTPLHVMFRCDMMTEKANHKTSLEFLKLALAIDPEAPAKVCGDVKETVLADAVQTRGCPSQIIQFLLRACPRAASIPCGVNGRVPLDYVVGVDAVEDERLNLAREIYDAAPEVIKKESLAGWSAFHRACMHSSEMRNDSSVRMIFSYRFCDCDIRSALWLLLKDPKIIVKLNTKRWEIRGDVRQTRSDREKIQRMVRDELKNPLALRLLNEHKFPFMDLYNLRKLQGLSMCMHEAQSFSLMNELTKDFFLFKLAGIIHGYSIDDADELEDYEVETYSLCFEYRKAMIESETSIISFMLCLNKANHGISSKKRRVGSRKTPKYCARGNALRRSGFADIDDDTVHGICKTIHSYLRPNYDKLFRHLLENVFFREYFTENADGEEENDYAKPTMKNILNGKWGC